MRIENLQNENRKYAKSIENFHVLEHVQDASVSPMNAMNEYFMSTLYPKTSHNHKGTDECRFCQRATNESDYRRHFRRFYLRICRCWWWNDDAVCTDFFSGISDAHGGSLVSPDFLPFTLSRTSSTVC